MLLNRIFDFYLCCCIFQNAVIKRKARGTFYSSYVIFSGINVYLSSFRKSAFIHIFQLNGCAELKDNYALYDNTEAARSCTPSNPNSAHVIQHTNPRIFHFPQPPPSGPYNDVPVVRRRRMCRTSHQSIIAVSCHAFCPCCVWDGNNEISLDPNDFLDSTVLNLTRRRGSVFTYRILLGVKY